MSAENLTVKGLDKFKDRLIKVTSNGEITYSIRKSEYQVWDEGYCEVLTRTSTLRTALSAYQAYCRELAA
ncbi:unnamed protein product [marine sediment metagenome]|uniref:Uncharacterized protein n=1 Tax=marine sediment metagenome TaxID=412755 RepID=X0TME2_9ZZZZ